MEISPEKFPGAFAFYSSKKIVERERSFPRINSYVSWTFGDWSTVIRFYSHWSSLIIYYFNVDTMHNVLLFLGGLGGWEIMIILLVVLVFFGANKIPEIARGMGRGIREFKDATKEIKDEIENHSVRLDK